VLVDLTLRSVAHAGRRYLAVVGRPAAERLAAEAAERERAELRTVSLTARAAAHEINNPLAVISGYLQLLEPRHAADSREGSWLRQMLDAAVRIRDSVDRLNRVTRIATTPTSETRPPMLDTHRSSSAPVATLLPEPSTHPRPPAP
jgi:nitrogen-specific signal transduction histidine kinase